MKLAIVLTTLALAANSAFADGTNSGTAVNSKVFGQWEVKNDVPSQDSADIWHFTGDVSLTANKIVLAATCKVAHGHATATVAIPVTVTATQIIVQYDAEQTVWFTTGWFGTGEQVSCKASLPAGPIDYTYDAANDKVTLGEQTYYRIHNDELGNYPLSQPSQ